MPCQFGMSWLSLHEVAKLPAAEDCKKTITGHEEEFILRPMSFSAGELQQLYNCQVAVYFISELVMSQNQIPTYKAQVDCSD